MIALAPVALARSARRAFRRKGRWILTCPVDRLPRRLNATVEDASDRLAGWLDAGLVELWTDPSGDASIVPTPALRSMLGAWEIDRGPRIKPRSVAMTDLGEGITADDFEGASPDPAESVLAAEWHASHKRRPLGPTWGRAVPVAGYCRPWGAPEIERNRMARPRKGEHVSCPECDGLELNGSGLCLVCGRTGSDARPRALADAPLPGRTAYRPDAVLAGGTR
jgi:hypothetical protein